MRKSFNVSFDTSGNALCEFSNFCIQSFRICIWSCPTIYESYESEYSILPSISCLLPTKASWYQTCMPACSYIHCVCVLDVYKLSRKFIYRMHLKRKTLQWSWYENLNNLFDDDDVWYLCLPSAHEFCNKCPITRR